MAAVGNTILQGRSENISQGGAGLFLPEPLPEGTRFALRFMTPYLEKFKWIDVSARVQYSILTSFDPPYRVGVRIVAADAEAKRRLAVLTAE